MAQLLSRIRYSLWFLPMVIVAAAVALAVGMLVLDSYVSQEALRSFPRLFGATAESERTMLSAIATSMITVAGVTFSITMVAVAQSASQYSSRVLGNFMRDHTNQVVLGVFVGVFAYCLVIMRTLRGTDEIEFVPAISALVAFLLALVAMGFLIYFIHHVASTLQSSTILMRVRIDTENAIERLFPDELGEEMEEVVPTELEDQAGASWHPVPSHKTGYIETVTEEPLFRAATEHHAIIRLDHPVGAFVAEGETLLSVCWLDAPGDPHDLPVQAAIGISRTRTVEQDAEFGIRQMVDVALKALSPGINDTTTAVNCIDHLSAVLCLAAHRRIAGRVRADGGRAAVIARGPTFRSLTDTAFDQIRRNAEGNITVLERLLASLERIAGFTRSSERRAVLIDHVDRIREVAARTIPADAERRRVERRCAEARARVGEAS